MLVSKSYIQCKNKQTVHLWFGSWILAEGRGQETDLQWKAESWILLLHWPQIFIIAIVFTQSNRIPRNQNRFSIWSATLRVTLHSPGKITASVSARVTFKSCWDSFPHPRTHTIFSIDATLVLSASQPEWQSNPFETASHIQEHEQSSVLMQL